VKTALGGRLSARWRMAGGAFAGQVAFSAVTLLGSILVARELGAADKGTLTAWTLATGIAGIALAGPLPTGLARSWLAGGRSWIRSAGVRHLSAVMPAVVVVVVVALALGADPVAVAFMVGVGLPAAVVGVDMRAVFAAAKRPWALHGNNLVRALVLTAGLGIAALASGASLELAYGLWAAGSALSILLALGLADPAAGQRPPPARRLAQLGRGSGLSRLSSVGVRRADQLVVVAIAGPTALGVYSVAANLSEITEYAGAAVGNATFEDRRTLDDATAARILRRLALLLALLTAAVVIAGFLLISPVFGSAFEEATTVLLLLAPGMLARGRAITAVQIMLARGQGTQSSRILLAVLAVGLPVWVAATAAWGIEGAAAATSCVYLLEATLTRRALLHAPERPA
jgi:O-antigen/teichoic acid export membrane protein